MRPAGKGPLDSLYFDYPRFAGAARRPSSTAPRQGIPS